MPRRPIQHQIADRSEAAFQRALPREWVFRPQAKDYGIDGEVEIFSEDGAATGLLFKVQLKATQAQQRAPSVRLRHATASYYNALRLPVLLVRYHEPSDSIYAKWFHSFDPHYGGAGRSYLTVRLGGEDAWTEQTGEQLREETEVFYRLRDSRGALPLQLAIASEDEVRGVSAGELRVAIREMLRPLPGVASVVPEGTKGAAMIVFSRDLIRADLRAGLSATIHFSGDQALTRTAQIEAADALICVALACAQAGLTEGAVRLAMAFGATSQILRRPEVAMRFVALFAQADRVVEALALARELAVDHPLDSTIGQLLTVPALRKAQAMTEAERQALSSFLEETLERAVTLGEASSLAPAHYNLGNWYRSIGRWAEGIEHFGAASATDPAYLERGYFHRELAGSLFELGRFEEAAIEYAQAINLGEGGMCSALQADALMMLGRYGESHELFAAYNQGNPGNPEWMLKEWILDRVRSQFGEVQQRQPERAAGLADVSDTTLSDDERAARLTEALELDALSPDAWFNLGAWAARQQRVEEAATAFATAAVLARGYLDAWVRATAMCASTLPASKDLLALVVSAAYLAKRGEYVTSLAAALRASATPAELAAPLMTFVADVVDQTSHPEETVVRMHGAAGSYEEIKLGGSVEHPEVEELPDD